MNPEEREFLRRTLALSEENNKILLKLQRTAHWHVIWVFIKILIVVVPLVVGYVFLEPYLDSITKSFGDIQTLLKLTQ